MLVNALIAHLAEFGIIMKQGKAGAAEAATLVQDAANTTLSSAAREALQPLVEQLRQTEERIARLEQCIVDWHKSNPTSQRLASIPGIGPITASAIVATITDARLSSSGRASCRLAWPGPAAELERRQEAAGRHHKEGRWLHPEASRHRRQCRTALRPKGEREFNHVGKEPFDEKAAQGRRGGIGEQDGKDQLGAAGTQ